MEGRADSAATATRPPRRSRPRLKDRVAHAYYDYGRLCSAHPFSCLTFSIITFLLLSYPAIGRFRLPSSSPMDVHWSSKESVSPGTDAPEWLYLAPRVYLQQIVVRGIVDPWDPTVLRSSMAVKGPLSRAFFIEKRLRDFVVMAKDGNLRLDNQCYHVRNKPLMPLLPNHGCLMLTPSLFWTNDEEKFFQDNDVLATIYAPMCTGSMCPRELLFGMPTRMTGIKPQFRTNRQRGIDYSITVVLLHYHPEYISALKTSLSSSPEFEAIKSKGVDESTFVHVFYRPRKYFSDYFPLITSYVVFLLYIYFSASKFEMVKSKWGLAFAAVMTVASTLTMTMGICAQLDLTMTLWGAELFPYLAMIVGLENTLCITRAVVYTPPTLDVRSRLAHGLSHEGYSITKNFLTELVILTAGFFTFVPEIQEFCTFAVIGLVVDFYMQLFFYAPCLTFDLLRMGAEDKQRFSLMLFKSDLVELQVYPPIRCPMQRLWPRLFEGFEQSGRGMFRVKSESGLNESLVGDSTLPSRPASHRRTASNSAVLVDSDMKGRKKLLSSPSNKSNRLRILYYWTRTRIVQRIIMVVTVAWILWLAFIVHQWRLLGNSPKSLDSENNETDSASDGFGVSHRRISTAPLEWGEWQKRTFKWWPVLFDEYNLSLSGQYITFLPPIVLRAVVPPNDASVVYSGGAEEPVVPPEQPDSDDSGDSRRVAASGGGSELKYRISWLELQMTVILVLSFGLFATVAAFILYVCLWRRGGDVGRIASEVVQSPKKTHRRVGSKAIVEAVPLIFSGHERDVECICYDENGIIASSCIGGRLLVWNAATGDCIRQLPRAATSVAPPRSRVPTVSISEAHSSSPEHDSLLRRRTVSNVSAPSGKSVAISGSSLLSSRSPNASCSDPVDVDARPDEQQRPATAASPAAAPPPPAPSQIWCMTMNKQNIILAGCANGRVEIWDVVSGNALGLYNRSPIGVTYVQLKGNRLIVARLNGTLDFVELRFSQNADQTPTKVIQCTHLNTVTAHQLPINAVRVAAISAVTASDDYTLKLFDLRTCRQTHTLNGHNAAVLIVCIDETDQVIYSSCAQGNIFCWDLIDGALLRTLDDAFYTNAPVQLACTEALLIGYSHDRKLWMWQKSSGQLITSIKREDDANNNIRPQTLSSKSCLVALSDQTAVTGQGASVTFWDLRYKVMLREVHLDKPSSVDVDKLIAIDPQSVACCKANNVYRINMPIIRLKNS